MLAVLVTQQIIALISILINILVTQVVQRNVLVDFERTLLNRPTPPLILVHESSIPTLMIELVSMKNLIIEEPT